MYNCRSIFIKNQYLASTTRRIFGRQTDLTSRTLSRTLSFSVSIPLINQRRLEKLRKDASTGNEESIALFVRELGKTNPREALATLEKSWENKSLPVTEALLREYLKIVAATNSFDKLNFIEMLRMIEKSGGTSVASTTPGVPSLSSQIAVPGLSPKNPMYVSQLPETFRSALWRLLKTLGTVFILASVISAMLDDKGGGIASRMGTLVLARTNIVILWLI